MARDTNFYYSFLVLPASQRRAIISVWDFCRAVDDAVDEPAEGDQESIGPALTYWREEVNRIFGDAEPASGQGRAVKSLVGQFDLTREPFDDLVDGVAMDAGHRRYATFPELREYCYRVASTVGLICVAIFGGRSKAAQEYAVELGLALQLTNILRDVPADLARGRLYVPLDEMQRFGCSEEDLRAARLDKVRPLLAYQATRSREYYAKARAVLPAAERRQLVAAEIMGAIYRRVLTRIEQRQYDVFSSVVRVPRPERAVVAAATWLKVRSGVGY